MRKVTVHARFGAELDAVNAEPPIAVFEIAEHGFDPRAPLVEPYELLGRVVWQVAHEIPGLFGVSVEDRDEMNRAKFALPHRSPTP